MDDAVLMSQVCHGNHDAFAELVGRHTQRFFTLAFRTLQNRGDAEDVVQAAFIKLWQKPQAWQCEKSRFTTWFYRVVLNACYDHQRKHRRMVQMDEPLVEAYQVPTQSEQTLLEQRQQDNWQQQCLETAIAKLPAAQRDALNLVIYSAVPQKQAAQIMGVSLKALESLLMRAKRALVSSVQAMQASQHARSTAV